MSNDQNLQQPTQPNNIRWKDDETGEQAKWLTPPPMIHPSTQFHNKNIAQAKDDEVQQQQPMQDNYKINNKNQYQKSTTTTTYTNKQQQQTTMKRKSNNRYNNNNNGYE